MIDQASKTWLRVGTTGEDFQQNVINRYSFTSAELLFVNFLKLQFLLYKEDYKSKYTNNEAMPAKSKSNNEDQ
jgi:hypothetical protein